MPNLRRRTPAQIEQLAAPALGTGEEIDHVGQCWATRQRLGVPLFFLARRRYFLVLTNRRALVFERRGPTKGSLSLGKRFDALTLERVRNRGLRSQVTVTGAGDVPLVFEFGPRERRLGRALAHALDRSTDAPAPPSTAPATTAAPVPAATTDVPPPTEAFWDR